MFKPGDEVGEFYEVKGVLGSGGFAYVYRAVERRLDREVALKVMSPDRVETEDDGERLRQRFLREARHVSKLDSPHAVTLHDHDILPDGRLYMVLEYVDGRTLDKVLESSGGMSADRIHRILVQLLDVLAEAHDAGILHRDVKPSNVMLHERRDGEDWLKLLDFGIAKKVASEGTDDDVTREGQLVGTPQYMSPEQLRQFPTTPASDLFSVGLLVYEMWAGRSPFASTDIIQIYDRMKQFRSDLGELVSAPEPIRSVAEKLLAPHPDERFQSAEAVLARLSEEETHAESSERREENPDANGSSSPSFPVGFDRLSDAPSSELQGVDLDSGNFSRAAAQTIDPRQRADGEVPPGAPTGSPPESPRDREPKRSGASSAPAPRSATSTGGGDAESTVETGRSFVPILLACSLAVGGTAAMFGFFSFVGDESPPAPDASVSRSKQQARASGSPSATSGHDTVDAASARERDGQQSEELRGAIRAGSSSVSDAIRVAQKRTDREARERELRRRKIGGGPDHSTGRGSGSPPDRDRNLESDESPDDEDPEEASSEGGVELEPLE